jgi:hypothetical protein
LSCGAFLPREKVFSLLREEADGEGIISMIEDTELKVAMLSIQRSEDAVISCPRCSYFEIIDTTHGKVALFFICKK